MDDQFPCLINNEQMGNKVGVEHQRDKNILLLLPFEETSIHIRQLGDLNSRGQSDLPSTNS